MDGGRSPGPGLGSRWRRAEGGGRLVARDRVRTALAVALSGALVLTVLAWLVDGDRDGDRVDDAVENVIDTVLPMGRGLSRALGEFVADLGSPVSTTLFMIAAALFAHLRCGPRALALVLVGPPVAMILQSTVLKPIIGRTRGEELAFPSGHTTSVTSIAIAMAVIVLSIPLAPKVRRWLLAALVVVPFAVAVCLVGRQYHYATDTVGAVGLALAVVLPVAVIIDAMADSLAEDPKEIGAAAPADAGGPAGSAGPPPFRGAGVGPGVPTARIDRPVGPSRGIGPAGALPPPGLPRMPMGPPPSAAPTERLPSLEAVSPSTEPAEAEAVAEAEPAAAVEPRPTDSVAARGESTVEPRPADSVPVDVVPVEPVAAESVPAEVQSTVEPRPADSVPVEPVPDEPTAAEPTAAEPAAAGAATDPEQVVPEPVAPEPAPDEAVSEPTDVPVAADVADTPGDEGPQVEPPAIPRPPRTGAPPPRVRRSDGRRSLTLRHPAGQRRGT